MHPTKRVSAALRRELKVYASIEPILQSILEPVVYLLIFAPLMGRVLSSVSFGNNSYGYISFILPGIVTLTAFVVGIRSGSKFVHEYTTGTLETLFSLPVSRFELFLAKVAAIVVQVWVEVLIVLGIGIVLASDVVLTVPRVALLFAVTAIFTSIFSSVMIFGATLLDEPRRFATLATVIMMPLMMLSSAFYPVVGEGVLAMVMTANPITQCARLIRTFLLSPEIAPAELLKPIAYLVGLSVVTFFLGARGYANVLDE